MNLGIRDLDWELGIGDGNSGMRIREWGFQVGVDCGVLCYLF